MRRIACLLLGLLLPSASLCAEPVSGYAFIDPSTREMQDDEFENPGMVTVDRGSELFHEHREAEEYSCSDCHERDAADLDPRQIARYPVFNPNLGGLLTLQERINYCWEISMDRFPLTPGDADLIALETFVRNRAKVGAFVRNAQVYLDLQAELGSFSDFLWGFVGGKPIVNTWQTLSQLPAVSPESETMSKALKQRGFSFVGPTICYAFMQAVGMVNDHTVDCFRYLEVQD